MRCQTIGPPAAVPAERRRPRSSASEDGHSTGPSIVAMFEPARPSATAGASSSVRSILETTQRLAMREPLTSSLAAGLGRSWCVSPMSTAWSKRSPVGSGTSLASSTRILTSFSERGSSDCE